MRCLATTRGCATGARALPAAGAPQRAVDAEPERVQAAAEARDDHARGHHQHPRQRHHDAVRLGAGAASARPLSQTAPASPARCGWSPGGQAVLDACRWVRSQAARTRIVESARHSRHPSLPTPMPGPWRSHCRNSSPTVPRQAAQPPHPAQAAARGPYPSGKCGAGLGAHPAHARVGDAHDQAAADQVARAGQAVRIGVRLQRPVRAHRPQRRPAGPRPAARRRAAVLTVASMRMPRTKASRQGTRRAHAQAGPPMLPARPCCAVLCPAVGHRLGWKEAAGVSRGHARAGGR